ncbi:MAG: translation initiation factor IF-2 [Actinomycetota bacterium]|nr:translation initiation factor IF-2 [Actinomycetota bacterium]
MSAKKKEKKEKEEKKDKKTGAKKAEVKKPVKKTRKAGTGSSKKDEKVSGKRPSAGKKKDTGGKKVKSASKKTVKKKTGAKAESKARTAKGKSKTVKKAAPKKSVVKKASAKAVKGKKEKDVKEKAGPEASPGVEKKQKKKAEWEKEKKQSVKSVIDRELDKEEKEGGLRLRPVRKKKVSPKKSGAKGTSKDKTKVLEKEVKKRPEIKKVIEVHESITIKKLSEKINVYSSEILKFLLDMGEVVNINQSLGRDLIEYLSHEYNFKYRIIGFEDKLNEVYKDSEEELEQKPPIVTVMGHVDHGKTTLLDVIRKTSVVVSEQGGITQKIGAYQISYKGRKITFIDTPGHEAFTSIRARGAKVTDIAAIIIAADDGIMPQTVEAINHARDANVPIIIVINKIDLEKANPDKVKKGLTEYNLVPEEWGGDTVCIEISAKNKLNLDEFLEMILLITDLNEIKGNPDAQGTGAIIESRLDKGLGPVGTVIVERGKLKVGDSFIAGGSIGKIRLLRDENMNSLKEAVLSQPVEVTGFSIVPKAGDKLFVVREEKVAKELLRKKNYDKKMAKIAGSRRSLTLEKLSELSKESEIKKLKIVLKADSEGSLDAVEKSLGKIKDEKVKIKVIHRAIGEITDNDTMLAAASGAIVIGFGVMSNKSAEVLCKKENVEVRTYNIIYKLIDDITLAFKGLLKPEIKKVKKGKAEVREIFKLPKVGIIAGSYIVEGEVERGNLVSVIRDKKVIYEGKVSTLHRFKEDVKKVATGYECGIRLDSFQDFNDGDVMEFFELK